MRPKSTIIRSLFFVSFIIGFNYINSQDVNWTHFRGSNLNGIAENENIPMKIDASSTKWKTAIHDFGYSSPVIWENQIWVTSASTDGKELYAICTDFETGKIIYDIKVFTPSAVEGKHSINTYASPTPCIEKGFVYVNYGSMGTACISTTNGTIVWKRNDLKCRHVQGPGSSPILYKNLLILHFEGVDVRYLVALDKSTGKLVWKSDRPSEPYEALPEIGRKAYTTPIVLNVKGKDMLISNGSAVCIAYEPTTGKEIWRIVNGRESTISMPFTEKGIVYWYGGFIQEGDGPKFTELLAVNPEGTGDIAAKNILWKKRDEQSTNQLLTPVIKNDLIYTITTRNKLMCIDAKNGTELWSTHLKSNYNASPLFINGNIWLFSVKGEVLVLKAGNKYEVAGQSQMDSGIWATPAVVRNSMIIRTEKFLYKIK